MPEVFLQLDNKEQSQIYRALAARLARSPVVLEKDVWVCWVLQTLFSMPGRLPMAFKGGTSLSKVFGVIARFSEDVAITLDYRGLDSSFDPFAAGVSKTRLKKFSEDLKSFVRDHAFDVVAPLSFGWNSVGMASRCACITQVCWERRGTMWATVS